MDKLTLDTNMLRDLAWSHNKSEEKRYDGDEVKRGELKELFDELRALRDKGVCELGITTQLYTDYGDIPGNLPDYINEMIGTYVNIASPNITTFPVGFPIAFPENGEIEQLFADVFPDSRPGDKNYKKNQKDVLQLYAHRVANRDIFITSDLNILRKRLILAGNWEIQVMTREDYIKLSQTK